MAEAIASGVLDADRFGAQVAQGKFSSAMHAATSLASTLGPPAGDVFGLALGLVYVPSGIVDAFALDAIHGINVDSSSGPRRSVMFPPQFGDLAALSSFVSRNHTRDALIRAVAFVESLHSRRPDAFDSGLGHPYEASRVARFAKALDLFAGTPAVLTELLTFVSKDDYKGAEAAAQTHLGIVGIHGGKTLNEPPFVADALLVSVIPTCFTLAFGRQLST